MGIIIKKSWHKAKSDAMTYGQLLYINKFGRIENHCRKKI
jgi:hypothetical protein